MVCRAYVFHISVERIIRKECMPIENGQWSGRFENIRMYVGSTHMDIPYTSHFVDGG